MLCIELDLIPPFSHAVAPCRIRALDQLEVSLLVARQPDNLILIMSLPPFNFEPPQKREQPLLSSNIVLTLERSLTVHHLFLILIDVISA